VSANNCLLPSTARAARCLTRTKSCTNRGLYRLEVPNV
jgi:hypothetical protein